MLQVLHIVAYQLRVYGVFLWRVYLNTAISKLSVSATQHSRELRRLLSFILQTVVCRWSEHTITFTCANLCSRSQL